jgi:hypothetical protein
VASAQNTQTAASGKTSALTTPVKPAGTPQSPVQQTTPQQTTPQRATPQQATPQQTTPQQTTPQQTTPQQKTPPRATPPRATPQQPAHTQPSAYEEAEQSPAESGEDEPVELRTALQSLLGKRDPVDLGPLFARNGGERLEEFEHMTDEEAALLTDPRGIERYELAQLVRAMHGGKRQKTAEWGEF